MSFESIERVLAGTWRATRAFIRALRAAPQTNAQNASELPRSYGTTRVVLLVIDPYKVHAYWEVVPKNLADARSRFRVDEQLRAVLRFHELNDGTFFDVEIDLKSRNWYIPLQAAGKSYLVELGLRASDGAFALLAKSNAVQTPKVWPEIQVEEHFMNVSQKHIRLVPSPIYHKPVPPPLPVGGHRAPTLRLVEASIPPASRLVEASIPPADVAELAEKKFVAGVSSVVPYSAER